MFTSLLSLITEMSNELCPFCEFHDCISLLLGSLWGYQYLIKLPLSTINYTTKERTAIYFFQHNLPTYLQLSMQKYFYDLKKVY